MRCLSCLEGTSFCWRPARSIRSFPSLLVRPCFAGILRLVSQRSVRFGAQLIATIETLRGGRPQTGLQCVQLLDFQD